MKASSTRQMIIGWIAVAISTLFTTIWAVWGIIENFHEGWYYESLWANLGLMFIQYLSLMLLFMLATVISIHWPRFGGGLHGMMALFAIWFFQAFSNTATFLIILPLLGVGGLYWFGRPRPRKAAIILAVGVPFLALLVVGIQPAVRVSQRIEDGNHRAQEIQGNEIHLTWAPEGPGWPDKGSDWYEAGRVCEYLSADGLSLATVPQDIWRLPGVDEVVRSMALHGQNSGGEWNVETAQATYRMTPDKESPLWRVYSPVIYWWTATEVDEDRAYMIVYDGKVWPRQKKIRPDYMGFRCVR